jgi:hypothetical protein
MGLKKFIQVECFAGYKRLTRVWVSREYKLELGHLGIRAPSTKR